MAEGLKDLQLKTPEEIQDWLVENIADRLEMETSELDVNEDLTTYGMSSREAIMLSGELEEWLGFELSPTLLYEYPIIKDLAELLSQGPDALDDGLGPAEGSALATPEPIDTPDQNFDSGFETYVEVVRHWAKVSPDKKATVFLRDGETDEQILTYAQLDTRARAIAARLQKMGMTGERALLLYPSGLDYISAFLGCLYAGTIAVPAYPPRKSRGLDRIDLIVEDSGAKVALLTQPILKDVRKFSEEGSALNEQVELVISNEIEDKEAENWEQPDINGETIAFLQYTSGSTGAPKGVMVTHSNILHQELLLKSRYDNDESLVTVCWLPIYHDMGLLGQTLQPIFCGGSLFFMNPVAFLEKPVRWLNAMTRYGAVAVTAPNFAYQLCVDKTTPEERKKIDLSTVKVAINGAEPVRASTQKAFAEAFAPHGFDPKAAFPSYGMAETTLLITTKDPGTETNVIHIDGKAYEQHRVELVDAGAKDAFTLVGNGHTSLGMEVVIADPETLAQLPEDRVGEIWVSGGSVAKGYWKKDEINEIIFNAHFSDNGKGPYLRTGDLGFLHNGELYITGRLKDLIIVRGRNHYPHDIEETIQASSPMFRKDGGAVFTVDAFGEERLVVVQELERTALRDLNETEAFELIRSAVSETHDIQVYGIALLSPGRLNKTTSGKIQRRATKLDYLQGKLDGQVAEWKLEMVEPSEIEKETSIPSPEVLLDMDSAERRRLFDTYFRNLIASTLKVPADAIDADKPVVKLGLDSMHAIEIKGRIEQDLGYELQVTRFMDGLSLSDLTVLLDERLPDLVKQNQEKSQQAEASNGQAQPTRNIDDMSVEEAQELLTDLDSLSPEEVDQLLKKLQ